ncbi:MULTISPECIES: hypothetical protein [Aeromonas]|uniref:hypothetical protein n=1 Tax=Aeromonas TaxID=642 RepID=UPI0015DCB478|nr:hypothetical protein [Aeromonas veronii]BBU05667.1 hypothetical protein WP9W18E04_30060 [Aeromonas veronii]
MNLQDKTEVEQIEAVENFCSTHVNFAQIDRYLQQLAKAEARLVQQLERHTKQVALLDAYARQLGGDPSLLLAMVNAPTSLNEEKLVQWMPTIFRNFWCSITPREFAMLAGLSAVPRITSPFPEPTPWSVEIAKRQILNLSETERSTLLDFCMKLPGMPEIRPAMDDLFEGRR